PGGVATEAVAGEDEALTEGRGHVAVLRGVAEPGLDATRPRPPPPPSPAGPPPPPSRRIVERRWWVTPSSGRPRKSQSRTRRPRTRDSRAPSFASTAFTAPWAIGSSRMSVWFGRGPPRSSRSRGSTRAGAGSLTERFLCEEEDDRARARIRHDSFDQPETGRRCEDEQHEDRAHHGHHPLDPLLTRARRLDVARHLDAALGAGAARLAHEDGPAPGTVDPLEDRQPGHSSGRARPQKDAAGKYRVSRCWRAGARAAPRLRRFPGRGPFPRAGPSTRAGRAAGTRHPGRARHTGSGTRTSMCDRRRRSKPPRRGTARGCGP